MGQRIFGEWLIEMVQSETFRVEQAAFRQAEGRQLVDITFDYDPVKPRSPVKGSVMTLDPENFWLLKSCEVKAVLPNESGRIKFAVEYSPGPAGFPLIRRHSLSTEATTPEGQIGLNQTTEYHLEIVDRVPESEFRLAAFGVPEPEKPDPQQQMRRWIWLISANLVLAFILLAVWFARRRQRTPA